MNQPERSRVSARSDMPDTSVQSVLTALSEASPTEGFEDRLLGHLASQQQQPSKGRHRWLLVFALPAAISACVVCAVAVRQYPAAHGTMALQPVDVPKRDLPGNASDRSSRMPRERETAASFPSASLDLNSVATHNRVGSTGTAAPSSRHGETRSGSGAGERTAAQSLPSPSDSAISGQPQQLEASYPAPEMPLTEEERLLLQIAHRNDPVQLALLNPHERNLTIARERAESKHFFAPRPLPPELQQQIDATVREQYALAQQPLQEKPTP